MKGFAKGFLATWAALALLIGCGSLAWADEEAKDIGKIEILVNGMISEEAPAIEYDGKPVEPFITVVPKLSAAQLKMMSVPDEARSIVVYEYDLMSLGERIVPAIGLSMFDADGMCLTDDVFAWFESDSAAKAFVGMAQKDYADSFLTGSTDDGIAHIQVNLRPSHLSKDAYERILVEAVGGLEMGPVEGKDYLVTYADNGKPGMRTATVTGIGDYSGSRTVEFRIVDGEVDGSDGTITGDGASTIASSANASAILGYVLLGFLIIVVIVIVLVLWRGVKSDSGEDSSDEK